MPHARPFTPQESAYVQAHVGALTVGQMAAHTGRSWASVRAHIRGLRRKGLLTEGPLRRHRQPWTAAEKETLHTLWGAQADLLVARRLGRTTTACAAMAGKLGISRRMNMYTATEVADILDVSPMRVLRWVQRKQLRASRTHFGQRGHRYWRVLAEDLETFILERRDLYNADAISRARHPFWWHLAHGVTGHKRTG